MKNLLFEMKLIETDAIISYIIDITIYILLVLAYSWDFGGKLQK